MFDNIGNVLCSAYKRISYFRHKFYHTSCVISQYTRLFTDTFEHIRFHSLVFHSSCSPLGTGRCSYRVRGVDGSCAEHLTVESYTVFICQQSYLRLFGIPSATHSFIPGLKPSFSANPSHCSPSFLLLKYLLHGFPGLFTVISEHICFLLLVFSCFYFYTF